MQKKLAMFIDDDEAFLVFIEKATAKVENFELTAVAKDGGEAMAILKARIQNREPIPTTIFVDVNMPGMDGFDFLEAFRVLRDEYPNELQFVKPIAMLTSSDQERDRVKAFELGADDYIIKPASLSEMRAILSKIVA